MSCSSKKVRFVENGHKPKTNVTQYDLREFSRELMAIQEYNREAKKKRTVKHKTDPSATMSKKQKDSQIEQIIADNMWDKRLDKLDSKPKLADLLVDFDKRFFNGLFKDKKVSIDWKKSSKNKLSFNEITNEKTKKGKSLHIGVSNTLVANRKDLTETILSAMIQTFAAFKTGETSIKDTKFQKIMTEKGQEINEIAKTNINFDKIIRQLNSGAKKKKCCSLKSTPKDQFTDQNSGDESNESEKDNDEEWEDYINEDINLVSLVI